MSLPAPPALSGRIPFATKAAAGQPPPLGIRRTFTGLGLCVSFRPSLDTWLDKVEVMLDSGVPEREKSHNPPGSAAQAGRRPIE